MLLQLPAKPLETILTPTEPLAKPNPEPMSTKTPTEAPTLPQQTSAAGLVTKIDNKIQESGSDAETILIPTELPEQKTALRPKSCDGAEVVEQNQRIEEPQLESGLDSKAGKQGCDWTEVGPSQSSERKKPKISHTGRVQLSASELSVSICMCD